MEVVSLLVISSQVTFKRSFIGKGNDQKNEKEREKQNVKHKFYKDKGKKRI